MLTRSFIQFEGTGEQVAELRKTLKRLCLERVFQGKLDEIGQSDPEEISGEADVYCMIEGQRAPVREFKRLAESFPGTSRIFWRTKEPARAGKIKFEDGRKTQDRVYRGESEINKFMTEDLMAGEEIS